jgi:hypothetical protein
MFGLFAIGSTESRPIKHAHNSFLNLRPNANQTNRGRGGFPKLLELRSWLMLGFHVRFRVDTFGCGALSFAF